MNDNNEKNGEAKLPALIARLKQNLSTAAMGIGTGGGGDFLRVDDRNGDMTVGTAREPFDNGRRYAANVRSFGHGYVVFGEGSKREVIVSMWEQPARPIPPNGYVQKFGDPGAKSADRIVLTPLDDRRRNITFDALGRSNANRVRALVEATIVHLDTEAGRDGYIHPVLRLFAGHYFHKEQGREIYHLDFEVIDWMNDDQDGSLWSSRQETPDDSGPDDDAPWTTAA
jgi:hypothetical protein